MPFSPLEDMAGVGGGGMSVQPESRLTRPHLAGTSIWTFSLQKSERSTSVPHRPPVYGILVQQPQQSKTERPGCNCCQHCRGSVTLSTSSASGLLVTRDPQTFCSQGSHCKVSFQVPLEQGRGACRVDQLSNLFQPP